jgi:hypothetical protein
MSQEGDELHYWEVTLKVRVRVSTEREAVRLGSEEMLRQITMKEGKTSISVRRIPWIGEEHSLGDMT